MTSLNAIWGWATANSSSRIRTLFWILGVFGGLIQAVATRTIISPDGLSYLNVARAYVKNGWHTGLNNYWSPLYSWLIAIPDALHFLNPNNELLVLHFLNFLIFLLTMASFDFFLSACLQNFTEHEGFPPLSPESSATLRCIAYLIFLCMTLQWSPVGLTTPDMLAALFSFLAAGFLVRINAGQEIAWNSVGFGACLALGYLAKAALYPFGILSLMLLFVVRRIASLSGRKLLLAPMAFVIVAGPFLGSLSVAKGRFTFGESGRVNYLMYGNGFPPYWFGEDIGGPTEPRGFQRTETHPVIFTFTDPFPGTYSPTFHPGEWYRNSHPNFQWKSQFLVLRETSLVLAGMFGNYGELAAAALALLLICPPSRRIAVLKQSWLLTIPPVFMFWLYAMVHIEERFLAGFMVIFWVGVLSAAVRGCQGRLRIVRPILIALSIILVVGFAWRTARQTVSIFQKLPNPAAMNTNSLESVGLKSQSKIGVLGYVFDVYAIRAGQFTVVAAIPPSSEDEYLAADEELVARTDQALATAGAEALMLKSTTPILQPGWVHAPNTDLYVKLLRHPGAAQ
jgi:hypothetical protein